MKGFYFSQVGEERLGPRKKILSQIHAFERSGIFLELVEHPFCREGRIRGNFFLRQIVCRLPFTYVYSKHKYEERYTGADIFYIRFIAGDYAFIRFLRDLRKKNPKAKILMEFADYPPTAYMTKSLLYTFLYLPIILKGWWAGRQYVKYVDRIVMPEKEKTAFHIPVIYLENGIDVEAIPKRRPIDSSEIHMIAVAGMCYFHGYDRMLEGLHRYYEKGGTRNIVFHMVGGQKKGGNELPRYYKLAQMYGLDEHVIFYGEKRGKELDEIYDECNLAVGALGAHRIQYKTVSPLKTREYLAKGLPTLVGGKDDLLGRDGFPYFEVVPDNDTPIDIERLICFFDNVYKNKTASEVNDYIRDFAIRNCTVAETMGAVIDYMLS